MKRCIVCKKHHGKEGLFCDDHADMPNSEKLVWYKQYDFLIENAKTVVDLEDYSMVLMIPRRNVEGVLDPTKARIIINGSVMKVNPPLYIKIDEKMLVDMKVTF